MTLGLAGSLLTVPVALAHSDVVGHAYVNDNTAGVNTIAGFNRFADGTLAPISGSPFTAGGAGTGAVIGSQGALQFADKGHLLLAVDAGSNSISVLRVHHNGALSRAYDGVVYSGGDTPVSIAVHGRLVYVGNSGGAIANYSGFTLSRRDTLRPLAGSTVSLPAGTVIGDVLFNGDGRHLAGTRVDTSTLPSEIDSFWVDDDGYLHAAPGSPFAAQSVGPFGSGFRPTNPNQLFVSNAHAGANAGTVSAYDVAANGVLNSITGSPFADHQTAPCWVDITPNGKYLFAVNTGTPSISSFGIGNDGTLSLVGNTPFKSPVGLRPFDAQTDPWGRYLYVTDAGLGAVSAFSISRGNLTELTASPTSLPAGATAFGIAVN
jgi:6-phosphogluconolactonase (cycloisomerase 2 family)